MNPDRPRLLAAARIAAAALLALTVLAVSPRLAHAQAGANPEIQALLQRIERLQRDMNTLQRQVYRGEPPPPSAAPAPGTGAGIMATEPNLAAAMQIRLDEVEAQMRNLTGRLEETNHAIAELSRKFEALAGDLEIRFKQLQEAAPAEPQAGPNAQAGAPSGPPPAQAAPSKEGVLGTLSLDDIEKNKAAAGAQTAKATLPKGTPEEQYQYATGYMARADWAGAEKALNAFLDAHPKHELAGNAQYWLGESHYVRGDFGNAALSFAKGYKDYPKSAKGPDNLLKLGLSLANLKKTESACATFARVPKDFPNAPPAIKTRAETERKKLRCR